MAKTFMTYEFPNGATMPIMTRICLDPRGQQFQLLMASPIGQEYIAAHERVVTAPEDEGVQALCSLMAAEDNLDYAEVMTVAMLIQ